MNDAGTATWLTRRTPIAPGDLPHPGIAPTAANTAGDLPRPTHEIDWDLSSDDPARDYARRYAFFTRRYGDAFSCVLFGDSEPDKDHQRVEVKTAANCPGAGAVRDVFLIDVAGDRLTVDDKNKRDRLALWPDGSDPEGPPSQPVREIDDMKNWHSPLADVLRGQRLVPVRVQAYGRGTYPVVSVAGWHANIQKDAPLATIEPLVNGLCGAGQNMPLAILAAMDRTRVLRVRCPPNIRWDTL